MGDNMDKQIIENDMAQALNVADESAAHDATAKKWLQTAEDREDSINDYQFQENCRHGDYKEDPENYDLEKIVVIRLGAKGEKSDNSMVRLLSKLFSQTISKEEKIEMLPNEFNIAVTETLSQEVDRMCNLSAGIYDRGIQKGQTEGIQIGQIETKKEMAFKLHDEEGFSFEKIASLASESLATVQRWFAERPSVAK